jgi:hypothetical protein
MPPSLPDLPNVLIEHVCKFLWWVEMVAVTATSCDCRDKLTGSKLLDIRAIIREQLVQATHSSSSADIILRLLQTSENQLTGSFVLQAMYGGVACPWRATVADVDVLVPPTAKALSPLCWEETIEYVSPGGGYENEPAHALISWNARRTIHITSKYLRGRGGGRGGRLIRHYSEFAQLDLTDKSSPFDHEFTPPLSFTHVGQETGRNSVDARSPDTLASSYAYASLADFVARESDFRFCQVGGTCAARACKLASPFPPSTPQVVLSAARAARIPMA